MERLLEGTINNAEEAEIAEINAAAFAQRAEAAAEDRAGVIALDATGATVTLPDSAERPLRALTVDITATQSADGTINGWSGAQLFTRGKNLLDSSLRTTAATNRGVTVQYNAEDDTYTFNGTATADVDLYKINHIIATPNGAPLTLSVQYISGSVTIPENSHSLVYVGHSDDAITVSNFKAVQLWQENKTNTIAPVKRYLQRSWFYVTAGVAFDNYKCRIQIEVGDTATEYEPFKGATAAVDFGREVYGGRYDWRTGELTVTHKKISFADLTWHGVNVGASGSKNWVSVFASNGVDDLNKSAHSKMLSTIAGYMNWGELFGLSTIDAPLAWAYAESYGYAFPKELLGLSDTATDDEVIAAATAYLNELGAYEVIEVATPEVVQLDPSALPSTLYPSTTIFADTGDVTLTHAADTKNYIDRRILELIDG